MSNAVVEKVFDMRVASLAEKFFLPPYFPSKRPVSSRSQTNTIRLTGDEGQ
jgi:hypothetical protein